jgi:rusticyanin
VLAVAVAGIGAGIAIANTRPSSASPSSTAPTGGVPYPYYQSRMGQYSSGSMMGGSYAGSMFGRSGYAWMMGGVDAPGWMRGGSIPRYVMGSSTDPGKAMGALWANAPGPRISANAAAQLGQRIPDGATLDAARNRITFTSSIVRLVVIAGPTGGPDETYRIAGMVNPTVVVPRGAHVRLEVVNSDSDSAHGLVVTGRGATSSWMPMMSATPALSGSALWFLANPTSAGMHEGLLNFTSNQSGTFHYLCPVPGHAQKGMIGALIVTG